MTRGKPRRVTEEPLRPFWIPAEPERRVVRQPEEPRREPARREEQEKVPVRR